MQHRTHILILEDYPPDAEITKREAERSGIISTIKIVDNEIEYRKALEEFKPEIILSDYALPNFNGMQALEIAKKYDNEIIFIVVTGSINEETAVDCIKAGADDYVIKEHMARLVPAIKRAAEKKKLIESKIKAEKAEKANQEKFLCFFNHAPEFCYIISKDGTILDINMPALEFLGYTKEELIGKKAPNVIYSKESKKRAIELLKITRTDSIKNEELEIINKYGETRTVLLSSVPITDETGELLYRISIQRDITSIKKAQYELKRSEERYRRFFDEDLTGDFSCTLDGKILICNRAFIKILRGRTLHDILAMDKKDFPFPDGQKGKYFELLKKDKKVSDLEMTLQALDGNNITIIQNLIGGYNDKGELREITGYMYDITKRKTFERRQNLTTNILTILNRKNEWEKIIHDILKEIREFTHIEAIGIRLKEGEDYPYYETKGFPPLFVIKEKYLCQKDESGNNIYGYDGTAKLECMCGKVIKGKIDRTKKHHTEYGSFWTNSTSELLNNECNEIMSRNYCNRSGYESMALIPIKSGDKIVGLLQLNDAQKGIFTEDAIQFLEELGAAIGIAIIRMKDEIRIRKSEEDYRNIFENSTIGIYRTTPDGKILLANPAIIKMLGYSCLKELSIKNAKEISYSNNETRERIKKDLENTGIVHGITEEWQKKDGTKIFVRESSRAVRDKYGNIQYYEGTLEDITEQKKAEEVISKLSKAVEQSPVSIVITDPRGNMEYINPRFTEVTGYTNEESIGKNPRILKSGNKTKTEYEELWSTISEGKVWRGEFLNMKKNGELYWEDAIISPITNQNGEITHFVGIKEDVTEKKMMLEELIMAKSQAEKSDRLKSEFLIQMSHEIRTPLNVIMSFNELIKSELKGRIEEELYEGFIHTESAIKRIIRTIELIINMSELMIGTFKYKPKIFDIQKVVNEIFKEYSHVAENKDIIYLCNNLPEKIEIFADEYSVKEIFVNIIDNAIKYTKAGSVIISFELNKEGYTDVIISDTGIGMSEIFLPHVFDPFMQEEQGYTRSYDGNGLGLSLAKRYSDINNASINIESQKGAGTKVTVTFRLRG